MKKGGLSDEYSNLTRWIEDADAKEVLTPAQLREGARRARELASKETALHLRQALAAHALDLVCLAEKLERNGPRRWTTGLGRSHLERKCRPYTANSAVRAQPVR
jgi:hypothetical protein